MSVSVSMPQLGESVTEGTVTRWLKREGEHVQADEPLLEVSTDKVDTEIPSPVSGVLRGITVAEDETSPSAPSWPSSRGRRGRSRLRSRAPRPSRRQPSQAPAAAGTCAPRPRTAVPYQQPAAAYEQPAASYEPPVPSYEPPAPSYAPPAQAEVTARRSAASARRRAAARGRAGAARVPVRGRGISRSWRL